MSFPHSSKSSDDDLVAEDVCDTVWNELQSEDALPDDAATDTAVVDAAPTRATSSTVDEPAPAETIPGADATRVSMDSLSRLPSMHTNADFCDHLRFLLSHARPPSDPYEWLVHSTATNPAAAATAREHASLELNPEKLLHSMQQANVQDFNTVWPLRTLWPTLSSLRGVTAVLDQGDADTGVPPPLRLLVALVRSPELQQMRGVVGLAVRMNMPGLIMALGNDCVDGWNFVFPAMFDLWKQAPTAPGASGFRLPTSEMRKVFQRVYVSDDHLRTMVAHYQYSMLDFCLQVCDHGASLCRGESAQHLLADLLILAKDQATVANVLLRYAGKPSAQHTFANQSLLAEALKFHIRKHTDALCARREERYVRLHENVVRRMCIRQLVSQDTLSQVLACAITHQNARMVELIVQSTAMDAHAHFDFAGEERFDLVKQVRAYVQQSHCVSPHPWDWADRHVLTSGSLLYRLHHYYHQDELWEVWMRRWLWVVTALVCAAVGIAALAAIIWVVFYIVRQF